MTQPYLNSNPNHRDLHGIEVDSILHLLVDGEYYQYDSSFLLPQPPKGSLGYGQFLHVDDEWSDRIARIQQANREYEMSDTSTMLSMTDGHTMIADFRLQTQLSLQSRELRRTHEVFEVVIIEWVNYSGHMQMLRFHPWDKVTTVFLR